MRRIDTAIGAAPTGHGVENFIRFQLLIFAAEIALNGCRASLPRADMQD